MKTWYEKRGFKEDPFSIKPSNFIIGLSSEIDKLTSSIISSKISLLHGTIGSGKTTLSKHLSNELKGKYKAIYINGDSYPKDQSIHSTVKKNVLDKIFNKKLIVFVDEAQSLDKSVITNLKGFHDDGLIHSLVFVQVEDKLNNAPDSLRNRIATKITTNSIGSKKIKKMLEKRIGKNKVFDDKSLDFISKYSNNPRSVLIFCSEICESNQGEGIIKLEEVLKFGKKHKTKKESSNRTTETKEAYNLIHSQEKIIKSLMYTQKTMQQIAKETGLSPNNVRQQIFKIKKKYNFMLKEEQSQEDKKVKLFSLQQPFERSRSKK